MARRPRVEYPGAIYHVMNRGDHQEPIFHKEADHRLFIDTLGEACAKTGWEVHAYCLMDNHFHLVVETPMGNLVAGMKWLLGTYTNRFNRRYRKFGHLFAGRYKALVVDSSGSGYLRTVCEYVHLNPARARLLRPTQRLSSYPWSSYPAYLLPAKKRPAWLRVDQVLGEAGVPKDTPAGRRRFQQLMEEKRQRESLDDYRKIRRGWCWGDKVFRKELLTQLDERLGPNHYGEERRQIAEHQAERVLADGLERQGIKAHELVNLPKNHRAKIRIAATIRRETAMTVEWIALRLHMGSRQYATKLLHQAGKTTKRSRR